MPQPVVEEPRENAPDPALEALNKASAPGSEYKISSHLLLEATDPERVGLDILHRDLFDSALPVVLSALGVLGRQRDPRSLKHICRLLTGQDESVQAAAVQALGAMGHPGCLRLLSDLFKITKNDRVRCAIMETLAALAPENVAILSLLRDNSASPLASADCRARAAFLLVKLQGEPAAELLLESGKPEIIEAVYGAAGQFANAGGATLQHGLDNYPRLSKGNRGLLIGLAGAASGPGARSLLLEGLADVEPEVRADTYQILGTNLVQLDYFPDILLALSKRVDPLLTLEEEALAAIERMESALSGVRLAPCTASQRIFAQVQELFKSVSTCYRQVTSDSHELGWLISRSRDYLEYYADEEFRQALLNYLKGGGYFTADRLLGMLKATALKVEVRHFDGYKALADIIQNPKRPGIALVAREMAIAKLGKREILYRLIRNLRLTRLVDVPAEAETLFRQIYLWAKEAKLYRLVEAALQALTTVNPARATELCEECLAPPVFSKLCAIAAIRLLKHLDWARMQPGVLRLLGGTDDANILLNLIDALSSWRPPLCGELVESLACLLGNCKDREVLGRAVELLGCQQDANILDRITADFEGREPWRQELVLAVIERRLAEGLVRNREGLSEFLYQVLRSGSGAPRLRAAVVLWKLRDEYALKVLQDYLRGGNVEQQTEIVRALQGAVNEKLVATLQPLLSVENASLQEALRTTLAAVMERPVRDRIRSAVLAVRGAGAAEGPLEGGEGEVQVDLDREKKAFRFEREHVQELAVLFTDIQGYSRKAQALSSLQLASLLQEYEGILLPTFAAHRGELIKRMGDGHMFVFQNALDATLASIRLQKALKRFNSYREEALRLVVRIGLHWGKVVCKEGDVLGNHVNIASRLESSSKGGSILVSDAVFQRLQGQIHVREIGLIEVKNITEPIKVYEPFEIALDLPAELDPLKHAGVATPPGNGNGRAASAPQTWILDRGAAEYLTETFATLARLCRDVENHKIPAERIRRELNGRWQKLRAVLAERHQK
jgi:class 3 adenylate cyclase/HEAT repeat protein